MVVGPGRVDNLRTGIICLYPDGLVEHEVATQFVITLGITKPDFGAFRLMSLEAYLQWARDNDLDERYLVPTPRGGFVRVLIFTDDARDLPFMIFLNLANGTHIDVMNMPDWLDNPDD